MKRFFLAVVAAGALVMIPACEKASEGENQIGPARAVDMGLSVFWAECNIGAMLPEEYGDYFTWGENSVKETYSWENYNWVEGEVHTITLGIEARIDATLTKYNTMSRYGKVDNLLVLEPKDDAAHEKMGAGWRIPTYEEWKELIDNCTWSWSIRNGVPGYLVTSNVKGNNSLFIPAAGGKWGTDIQRDKDYVVGWSSTLYADLPVGGWVFAGKKDGIEMLGNIRAVGIPVRPVYGECKLKPGGSIYVDPVSFSLSAAAQTIEVTLLKNVEYSVSIDDAGKDWISSVGSKAFDSGKVSFSIAENTSYDSRTGKITFRAKGSDVSKTVTVYQSEAEGLFASKKEYEVSSSSQTLDVDIQTNVGFDVESNVDWISYVTTKSLQRAVVVLQINANPLEKAREGTVIIKHGDGTLSEKITIKQKQKDVLTVNQNAFNIDFDAQIVTIDVISNVSYQVVIPDDAQSWISVASDTGSQILLSIQQNANKNARTASITIRQENGSLYQTISIRQAGIPLVTAITLDQTRLDLVAGETRTLIATVTPDNAFYKTLDWSSSKTSVATVDENGKVVAIHRGIAIIYAKAKDGSGKSASCVVYVSSPCPAGAVYMGTKDSNGFNLYWANNNIGASTPEEFGDYYAWGETETKTDYYWDNYKYCDGTSKKMTKYNNNDRLTQLDYWDDVAYKKYGGYWHIPTEAEWMDLLNTCTWAWTSRNGIAGYSVTAPNGNSLFLPAAGTSGGIWYTDEAGRSLSLYQSSTRHKDFPEDLICLSLSSNEVRISVALRCSGLPVRPVTIE